MLKDDSNYAYHLDPADVIAIDLEEHPVLWRLLEDLLAPFAIDRDFPA